MLHLIIAFTHKDNTIAYKIFIKFLLQEKVDPTVEDIHGQTALLTFIKLIQDDKQLFLHLVLRAIEYGGIEAVFKSQVLSLIIEQDLDQYLQVLLDNVEVIFQKFSNQVALKKTLDLLDNDICLNEDSACYKTIIQSEFLMGTYA